MWGRDDQIRADVAELSARVGQLESILDAIQLRLEALHGLTDLVAQAQNVAHMAAERAEEALQGLDATSVLPGIVDDLKVAVAHGIEHVERTEARIRATVQRARKELSDDDRFHPGLEAEAATLRLYDGLAGGGGGVPPVSNGVAEPEESLQSALLVKLRGMGLSA